MFGGVGVSGGSTGKTIHCTYPTYSCFCSGGEDFIAQAMSSRTQSTHQSRATCRSNRLLISSAILVAV